MSDARGAGTSGGDQPRKQRFRWVGQLRQAYQYGRVGDPRLGWVVLGVFLVTWAVFVGVGFLLHAPVFLAILGLLGANHATAAAGLGNGQRPVRQPAEQTLAPTTNAPEMPRIPIVELQAAERGDPAAQFAIGTKYAAGDGVAQDDVEAVRGVGPAGGR